MNDFSFTDEYGNKPLQFVVDNVNEKVAVKKADYLLSLKQLDLRFVFYDMHVFFSRPPSSFV